MNPIAAIALTAHAHLAGNYIRFMLGLTALLVGAGTRLLASSGRD